MPSQLNIQQTQLKKKNSRNTADFSVDLINSLFIIFIKLENNCPLHT